MKKIFSIKIDKEFDKQLHATYTHALKQRASVRMNDETIMNTPYYPGIAWLAWKDVKEEESFESQDWWIPYAIEEIYDDFKISNGDAVIAYKEKTKADEIRIERAKYLIERVWKEAMEQIDLFVSDIFLFKSEKVYASASGWGYGAVFINLPDEDNAVDMMDFLLHESGHLVLLTKQAFGKLIENDGDTVYSPIREEERWLNGVLHAIFVSSRVLEGLVRLETIESELTPEERKNAIRLYERNLMVVRDSLKNIDEVAIYTEMGEHFMNEIREKMKIYEQKKNLFVK